MTTPRNICTLALKLCGAIGVGQTPLAEDINDAFSLLNMMVGQWAQKRYLVYHLVEVYFMASGAASYSIGPGATVNTVRPDRLESAFARMLNGGGGGQAIDYPLEIIEAREDWNLIPFKSMAGFPTTIFYDSGFPLGALYVNPLPNAQFEIHLSVKQPISSFANLSDNVNLPDEYQEALLYNLACRLFPMYGLAPRGDVVALAKAALNTIRNSNTQIATLRMPIGMPGMRRGWASGLGGIAIPGSGSGADYTPPVIIPPGGGTGGGTASDNYGVLGTMILGAGAQGSAGGTASGSSSVLGVGVLGTMVLGA